MILTEKIAEILGGVKLLGRDVRSLHDLSVLVQHGLPKQSLTHTVKRIGSTVEERNSIKYTLVPEASYKRRKQFLKPEESERTERLARIIATSDYVWNDISASFAFLTSPHPGFNNQKPYEVARTELGAREVEELLWQIYYGLPS